MQGLSIDNPRLIVATRVLHNHAMNRPSRIEMQRIAAHSLRLLCCCSIIEGIYSLFCASFQSVPCHLAMLTLFLREFTRLWATLLSGEYVSVSS